jgi:hypothetical protein
MRPLTYHLSYDEFQERVQERVTHYVTELELNEWGTIWADRLINTYDKLFPKLFESLENIIQTIELKINSISSLYNLLNDRNIIKELKKDEVYRDWIKQCQSLSKVIRDQVEEIQNQQITKVIEETLIDELNINLVRNSNSWYPDLYFKENDYSFLPKNVSNEPCVKGKAGTIPTNVPDGLEVKTNKGQRVKIDAHARHPGFHICFLWEVKHGKFFINCVVFNYIRKEDYYKCNVNSEGTTIKYSLYRRHFVPIISRLPKSLIF